MPETLETRVSQLESLMAELPQILNLRQERLENHMRDNIGRFDEMAGRMNLLDKQMGMILRDMRDLRGGVTRQLIAQDERIAEIAADVSVLKSDVAVLKSDVAVLKSDVAGLKSDVAEMKLGFIHMQRGIDLILTRLPAG